MPLSSPAAGIDLREEGARCKASLEQFTEGLIENLALSPSEAEQLCSYDHSRRNGNMYLHFPFCFLEAFSDVALEQVRTIALSGVLWMTYMRAQDDAIDKNRSVEPALLFVRDLYLRESLRLLYAIFPTDSKFWHAYSTYFNQYAIAVLSEMRNHSSAESDYGEEEFCTISKGKAAMAKYPVAALGELSEKSGSLTLLLESLDCFHIGYQYWDDVVDWKEDLMCSKFSLLLSRAIREVTVEELNGSPAKLRERVGNIVYYSRLAEANLEESHRWLQRAFELATEAGCSVWANYVSKLQNQTAVLANDLRTIMRSQTSENCLFQSCSRSGQTG